MALMGIASGMLIVPLEAILQWRAPDDRRGSVIALANVLIFSGVLAGSLATFALSRAGVSSRGVLMAAAVATIAGTVWALRILPEALLRLVLVLLTHTFYRLRVIGRAGVPASGGGTRKAPNALRTIQISTRCPLTSSERSRSLPAAKSTSSISGAATPR